MTDVIVFHHAQGLTDGVAAFADQLRAAGHTVQTPDLYDGKMFATTADGVSHAHEIGFGTILDRGRQAAESLPADIVYVGFSLGVMPAQMLTQTRPGARGAVLCHSCVPPSEFGSPWPDGVAAQVHMADPDEWAGEDIDAARELAATVPTVELFMYHDVGHLFSDASLPDYDETAATLLKERMLKFLDGVRPNS